MPSEYEKCATSKAKPCPEKSQMKDCKADATKITSKKSSFKKEELLKGKQQLHHVSKSDICDKSIPNVKRAMQQAAEKKKC